MAKFVWTHSGSYPAGPNPWNGHPLAIAPAQTYFVPSPASSPVKILAENLNFEFGQIADNIDTLFNNQQGYGVVGVSNDAIGASFGAVTSTNITSTTPTTLTNTAINPLGSILFQVQASDYIVLDVQLSLLAQQAGAGNYGVAIAPALRYGAGTTVVVLGFQSVLGVWGTGTGVVTQYSMKVRGVANALGISGSLPSTVNFDVRAWKINGGDPDANVQIWGPGSVSMCILRPVAAL